MDPTDDRLELFFSQSLDGFFFMMLDEPLAWSDGANKDALLEYALDHHRVTLVNDAMLRQYGATRDQFVGKVAAVDARIGDEDLELLPAAGVSHDVLSQGVTTPSRSCAVQFCKDTVHAPDVDIPATPLRCGSASAQRHQAHAPGRAQLPSTCWPRSPPSSVASRWRT